MHRKLQKGLFLDAQYWKFVEHKSNLQRIRDSPALTHITFLTGPQTDHLLALMATWNFLSHQMPYFTLHSPCQKKKQEWTTIAGSTVLLGGGGEEGKVSCSFFIPHSLLPAILPEGKLISCYSTYSNWDTGRGLRYHPVQLLIAVKREMRWAEPHSPVADHWAWMGLPDSFSTLLPDSKTISMGKKDRSYQKCWYCNRLKRSMSKEYRRRQAKITKSSSLGHSWTTGRRVPIAFVKKDSSHN